MLFTASTTKKRMWHDLVANAVACGLEQSKWCTGSDAARWRHLPAPIWGHATAVARKCSIAALRPSSELGERPDVIFVQRRVE
jgi:hypothetical protein